MKILSRLLLSMVLLPLLLNLSVSVSLADGPHNDIPPLTSELSLGYRAVDTQKQGGRALRYSYLDSSATAALDLKFLSLDYRVNFSGNYLNEEDYLTELDLDYKGLVRLTVDSEKLFHNLDHIHYQRPLTDYDTGLTTVDQDDDLSGNYSVSTAINKVHSRFKFSEYPAHLTLGYRRIDRSGERQLRYLNQKNHQFIMVSKNRKIDQVTDEFTMGVDAHVGYVNLALEHVYREFTNKAAIPFDEFGRAVNFEDPQDFRIPGTYQHDEHPDSRFYATTLKASTSPSGGLTGAASVTLGKKENLSDLGADLVGVQSETDFSKVTGDLTLTPHAKVTLAFRYRFYDQDNSASSRLYLASQSEPRIETIRQNVDLTRATYNSKISYRPLAQLTLSGEYDRKEIQRNQPDANPDAWELPEEEIVDRYKIGFLARPFGPSLLRLQGWYEYLHSGDPAYGAALEDQHQLYAGFNWTPSARFGATGSFRLTDGANHNFRHPGHAEALERRNTQEDFTAGIWGQPTERLSLNLHYGFLRSDTDQDVALGADEFSAVDADYRQRVHTTTLTASWQLTRQLNALAEARYIRSHAWFNPDYFVSTIFDTSSLRELSELEITQTGFGMGLLWDFNNGWSCQARFSHDDYEDRNSSDFDGTAQTYLLNLARVW